MTFSKVMHIWLEFRNFNWNFDWNFKWNFGETLLKFQWNLPWNFIAILTFWNFDEQFFEISIKLTFHSNFMANFYDLWNFVKLCYWNFMKFHWNFMYFQIVWNFGTLCTAPLKRYIFPSSSSCYTIILVLIFNLLM